MDSMFQSFANGAVNLGHGTDAIWRGRFLSGTVGIVRVPGAGIQTFVGGTADAPFVAPFLSVSTNGETSEAGRSNAHKLPQSDPLGTKALSP